MLHALRNHDSLLPLLVMLVFVGLAGLVMIYVLTDRRRSHLKRMESLPLDDGRPIPPTRSESGHG